MKASVIKAFPGRPDNEVLARTIKVGEVIEGELAAVALREGWAEAEKAENEEGDILEGDGSGQALPPIDDPLQERESPTPVPEAAAIPPEFAAFDHDGNGKPGGSKPKGKAKAKAKAKA